MIKTAIGKSLFALLTLAAAGLMQPSAVLAANATGVQARAVPTDVFDLLVGGTWEHKGKTGYYRVMALAAGKAGKGHAEVWLQWIATGKKNAKILKSLPVTEVTKLKLASLSLALDVEEAGNVILVVTHYDVEKDESRTLEFRATTPGSYKELETKVASDQ
ncbi:MAG: hypothetical protein ACR2O4_05305 [Hyphomicrobiaceae bacterium]